MSREQGGAIIQGLSRCYCCRSSKGDLVDLTLFGRDPNAKQSFERVSVSLESCQSADSQRIASDSVILLGQPRRTCLLPECLALATSPHCTFRSYWAILYYHNWVSPL